MSEPQPGMKPPRHGIPLVFWFVLLGLIFLALPFGLYRLLEAADTDKRELLMDGVQERGRLAMEILRPVLEKGADSGLFTAPNVMQPLSGPDTVLRLFFRPADDGGGSHFYVAAAPERSRDELLRERQSLKELGIFNQLDQACARGFSVVGRHRLAKTSEELVTAVTPLSTPDGCWTLLTTLSTAAYTTSSIGRPYWETPEIRLGAMAYLTSVIVAAGIFWLMWRGLRQLTDRAREIRLRGGSAAGFSNDLGPREFLLVGRELDRLVSALDRSVNLIREVAVENAHAFKRPVAIIRQSVEPVRRRSDDARLQRAADVIDLALDRLEGLIAAAWRVDDLVANLMQPHRERVDVSARLAEIGRAYGKLAQGSGINFNADIAPNVSITAAAELVDGMVENLLDNALSFTPSDGEILLHLRQETGLVEISVSDTGPGVTEMLLGKIFDRYYSERTEKKHQSEIGHLGLGLWLVRRNAEALGGAVIAQNRSGGGLRVTITLPTTPEIG